MMALVQLNEKGNGRIYNNSMDNPYQTKLLYIPTVEFTAYCNFMHVCMHVCACFTAQHNRAPAVIKYVL
jgi:hypothetical protein